MEINNKNFLNLADEALEGVTGGASKTNGWTCAACGAVVTAAKAKDGKAYCISCYRKLVGDVLETSLRGQIPRSI